MLRSLIPCLLLIATPAAAQPVAADPALWRVADADTTIYLFGTIHVLPDDFSWRGGEVERAILEADELVIETLIPDDPNAAVQMLAAVGLSPGLPPLAERIAADEVATMRAMLARGRAPEAALNNFETWAAALILVGLSLGELGLTADSGVEEELETVFQSAGKPIVGLETPIEQLDTLDTLSEEAQRAFLESVIDTPEAIRAEFDAMLAAWAAGDEVAIARSFDELSEVPEIRDALLIRRNANWARWIAARLARPGTALVAVGSAHLVGEGSVQAQLAAAGVESQRVE